MLRLKCCPRCKGAVALDKDRYGWYELCLQCGYLRDLESIAQVHQQPGLMVKKSRGRRSATDEVGNHDKDSCLTVRV
jgi:hypothetical protein